MKSQCIQGRFEQEVLLEAIAPSSPLHHLALKRFEIQSDRMPEERGEILERNRFDVPEVQLPKRMHRGGSAAFIADSHQISFEIERFHATFDADLPALLPWVPKNFVGSDAQGDDRFWAGCRYMPFTFPEPLGVPLPRLASGKSYGLYYKRIYSRFSSKSYTSNQT